MERIKVMLVDDDHLVLHDLQRLIDWQELGFEITAIAFNGKLGIDRCEKCKPQIIFTDIKMPIMDGLEMMKAIKEMNKSIEFVVLSAYGEFEYAKQAIGLGAYAYILKDEINANSLLSIVLPLKDLVYRQAETAFMSIYNFVYAFLEGVHQEPEVLFSDLERFFYMYHDNGEDGWNLKNLSGKLSDLIESAYRKHGKASLFLRPAVTTKDKLYQWVCDQVRLVHRWHFEEKEGLSPYTSKAILFIQNNYSDKDLSIQKIADGIQMSASWLSVCFKKELACTINEYIKNTRIEKAKELLGRNEYKVYEVADLVGFSSSQYFSKVFYQETKRIPQQYRREPEE